MKKSRQVAVSNSLTEACYKSTLSELKIFMAVISCINRTDEDFKLYTFSTIELAKIADIDKQNAYRDIEPAIDSLQGKMVMIREGNERIKVNLFSAARYRDDEGLVSLRFDPALKKHLLQLKSCFTLVNLNIILSFKSVYSIRIYFLLKQYQNIGKRKMLFKELKSMLCIEEKYKLFSDFRRFVLEHTKSEFEEEIYDGKKKSDISFDFQLIRKGRSVHTILFIIIDQSKIVIARKEEIKQIPDSSPEIVHDDEKLFAQFVEEIKLNDRYVYDLYQATGRTHKVVTLTYQAYLQELIQAGRI